MALAQTKYINNLKKPLYPTPTGNPILSSNVAATTPKVNMSVAPKPLSPSGSAYSTYLNNLKKPTTPVQTTMDTPAPKVTSPQPTNTPQAPLNPYNPTNGIIPTAPKGTVQTAPTTAPKPTQKDAYISAYKSYIDSLKESSDIKEAKQVYNDYVANIAKSKAGLEGQGRGIPLSIVRGTQEKLLGQTQPEAQRLLGEIGIAQDAQKATQESLKAGVDFEGKILDETKPIEVGGQLYQKQDDGSYKVIAGGKSAEGFTLGKDQVRYDAQGNIIAGGGIGTNTGGAYTPGIDPQTDAWVKYVQNGGKITDVPDQYQNAVAQGVTTQDKPQSEISKQVVSVIDELLLNPGLSRISGLTDQFLGGLTGDAALAKNKFNQLKGLLSLDNIKLLKGTGAISDAEQRLLENAASAVERNLSDADFRAELVKLKDGLDTIKDNSIAPDEEAFLKSKGYSQSEIDALKMSFNSVGNTTASIPESSRLAYVNNNPGNLRFAGQAGAVQGEGGFAKFPTVEAGIKALENQIKLDASRGLTLAQFISKYAPPSENDTNKYIQDVIKMVGKSQNTKIADIDIKSLTKAIAQKESSTKIA